MAAIFDFQINGYTFGLGAGKRHMERETRTGILKISDWNGIG